MTRIRGPASHLLHLKSEYDVLVNKYGCIVQEMYTVQDPAAQVPPYEFLILSPLHCLHKAMCEIRNHLNWEILDQLCHRLKVFCLGR